MVHHLKDQKALKLAHSLFLAMICCVNFSLAQNKLSEIDAKILGDVLSETGSDSFEGKCLDTTWINKYFNYRYLGKESGFFVEFNGDSIVKKSLSSRPEMQQQFHSKLKKLDLYFGKDDLIKILSGDSCFQQSRLTANPDLNKRIVPEYRDGRTVSLPLYSVNGKYALIEVKNKYSSRYIIYNSRNGEWKKVDQITNY